MAACRRAADAFRAESVALPGYDPPVRDRRCGRRLGRRRRFGALRRRLTIAALVSLLAIGLYAAALARPLLRSLNRVASVAEQAMLDPLTGTANRRGFERALEVELERSARRGHPCALVIVDLDNFKLVNDRHGHGVGDEVLVMLAERLRDSVRSADTVARLGGEEFALLFPETGLAGALAVAERARSAFAASGMRLKGGGRLTVTASFGAADFPASPDRTIADAGRRQGALYCQAARQESGRPGDAGGRSRLARLVGGGAVAPCQRVLAAGFLYRCDSAGFAVDEARVKGAWRRRSAGWLFYDRDPDRRRREMAVAYVQEFAIVDGDTSTANYDAVVAALGHEGSAGRVWSYTRPASTTRRACSGSSTCGRAARQGNSGWRPSSTRCSSE